MNERSGLPEGASIPMLPRAPDRFEEWLRMPMARNLGNERFDVRRAEPQELESLYALVNDTLAHAP